MTALASETDAYNPRADWVALVTLHTAKGLEFPVMFIVGCEEGLLPYMGDSEAAPVEVRERQYRPLARKPESGQMSLF